MRFDSYHLFLNLLYFSTVIGCTVCFRHPVFLAISFVCAFAYSVKLKGIRGFLFDLCMLPLAALIAFWYSGYHHFGLTTLGHNFVGNRVTLESAVYGLVVGFTCTGVFVWMSCVHAIFTADKTVYLFGRISPHLSLFLAILLRAVPRIKATAKRIRTARRGIGRGNGLINSLRLCSGLITWMMEAFLISAQSMNSRGYTLPGRTAFSIYRFDNRDRALVVTMFGCITFLVMAVLLHQTSASYDPVILLNPITPLSFVFYGGYAVFCLIPLGLQLFGECRFRYLQTHT